MTLMTPQIYTTETQAVRGLAALIEAYPQEATAALRGSGFELSGLIDPLSVRPEKARSDLPVRTETNEVIHFEVKVDDHVDPTQLRGICAKYPKAKIVLLIADKESPDVVGISSDLLNKITIIEWSVFLSWFSSAHVARLQADVRSIVEDPCSKRSQRYVLRSALDSVSVPDSAWDPQLIPTENRLPAVLLDSPCGNVRAQLEVTKQRGVLRFTPGIGFIYPRGDAEESANAKLIALLRKVRSPLEEAEREHQFVISMNMNKSSQRVKDLGFEDAPYYTRGYEGDYIGVKLKSTADAHAALEQLYNAFRVFETVAQLP